MSEPLNIDYAIVSAFERSKRKQEKRTSAHVFAIVLVALFFVVLMGCLAVGVGLYSNVSNLQAQANDTRMQSGLLATLIRANDAADALEVGVGPEGDALVLVERLDSGTYETRIYRYQGAIMQEYAIAGHPIDPDNAIKIEDSDTFEFSYENGLVTVITDGGAWSVALRSVQGGEAS